MELGVFPVRTVEANGPKQVDSEAGDRYSNNESAASKADSGDHDTFSRHMRRKDGQSARDERNSSTGDKNSDEGKVKEMGGDKKPAKTGGSENQDAGRDNTGFVAVEVAMKTEMPTKKEIRLAPLTKAPSLVGEFKRGTADSSVVNGNFGKAQLWLAIPTKGQLATEVTSALQKAPETAVVDLAKQNIGKNAISVNSPVVLKAAATSGAASMLVKPGLAIAPVNGILAEGIALPSDLVLDAPHDELPKLDTVNLANFRALKTVSLASQPTVNASLMTFSAGLDDFQSHADIGIEAKMPAIGGVESLSMLKSGMATAVQTMAASQPAAATAAAQLVAAIRTETKNGTIEVRLDPPEMGRVRISLSVETADAVKAVLTVERPETLDHLRRNMAQFTDDLRLAGFTSVDVEFSENGGSSAFQDEAGASEHDPFASFVPETTPNNIVYLSLRENAQLDLLV